MDSLLGPIEAVPSLELLGPQGSEIIRLFTRPFLLMHRASELYTARICLLLLLDLGWEDRLRAGTTLDQLCLGLSDQVRKPLAWMLPFLTYEGLLTRMGEVYTLSGNPPLDLAGIRALMEAEAPDHGVNFDLLDGVRERIRPYFTEGKAGEGLLFDLTLFPLWLSYFRNENLCYYPNNLLALLALREQLPEGARVMELGAGAGSFAQLVAWKGAEEGWLARIAEYRFTDVAPTFLRRAQRELKAAAPGLPLSFQALDLNRPLEDQGIGPASLDAIVGINVLHVAQDLEATLGDLRSRLKPSGRLVIGECLKPTLDQPLYLEFFFNFIKSFTEVTLDPRWRPRHGFLTPEAWDEALRHAGFAQIAHTPPPRPLMDRHPNFTVGALTARA
ncbi:MAG: class I SAM-dependent methyltransferase [Geothrix sp.]|uniref:class I SAM-dependent methyltransferase n=1 Tax=Geothrix sp. TaxID=1962974 RepID=UPI0017F01343|nr:class I SAM-dependent methyltransferase [Geothrix sp.]NWJ41813.1 class I SAM-dependent methyltransferase [Geothrix sp.]WIL20209.1 MAG: class I SAM-dependent methyltransferase [Geothrix sp.]